MKLATFTIALSMFQGKYFFFKIRGNNPNSVDTYLNQTIS